MFIKASAALRNDDASISALARAGDVYHIADTQTEYTKLFYQ